MAELTVTTQPTKFGTESVVAYNTHSSHASDNLATRSYGVSLNSAITRKPVITFNVPTSMGWSTDAQVSEDYYFLTAISLALIPESGYRTIMAILASSESYTGDIGTGKTSALKSAKYNDTKLALKRTSELLGPVQGYPDCSEITKQVEALMEKLHVARDLATLCECTDERAEIAVARAAKIIRLWFAELSEQDAIDFTTKLRIDILGAWVDSVTVAESGLNVTWKTQYLTNAQIAALAEVGFFAEIVKAWVRYVDSSGKFVDVTVEGFDDPFKLQHVSEDSAYAKVMSGDEVVINNPGSGTGTSTVTYSEDDDKPADDAIISTPDIGQTFNGGDNNIVSDPPALRDSEIVPDECSQIERSSACIGIAAIIGAVSQTEYSKVATTLAEYPKLSDKAFKKKYAIKHVVPDVTGELNHELVDVDIPKYQLRHMRDNITKYASEAYSEWWKTVGSKLGDLTGKLHRAQDGKDYVIIKNSPYEWDLTVMAQMATMEDEDVWGVNESDNWFWQGFLGPAVKPGWFCIEASQMKEKPSGLTGVKHYNTLVVERIVSEGQDVFVNLSNFLPIHEIEYDHCVNAYKARAEENMAVNRQAGRRTSSPWWWLLLLLIPIIAIIIYAGGYSDKTKETKSSGN